MSLTRRSCARSKMPTICVSHCAPESRVLRNVLRLGARLCACLVAASACALAPPVLVPPSGIVGCYVLDGSLPPAFADSLGYHVPTHVQLDSVVIPDSYGFVEGRWRVLPTDFEYHPYWTVPDDSVAVVFPGPLDALVLRLGRNSGGLSGHATYGARNSGQPVAVVATSASCTNLPIELTRAD